MGKISTKKNKTEYQLCRENLGWSREKASEKLTISPERLERIENEKLAIYPEEVILMSKIYKNANLCNYYCSHSCPIGKKYVPEVKLSNLSQIVLEMVVSLNKANEHKNRLMEIIVDGKVSNDEIEDFVKIQEELKQISMTVSALQLWSEQMIANGNIDINKINEIKESN